MNRSGTKSANIGFFAAGLTVWGLAWAQQSHFWRAAPENGFGWLVPILGLFLFGEAWLARPGPTPCLGRSAWKITLSVSAAVLLVSRVLLRPFPGWPSVLWLQAFGALAFCFALIGKKGGRPWLFHFAGPCLFFLTALPWPTTLQNGIVGFLRPLVADFAALAVDLAGWSAQASGTTIVVASGRLGVDEACSGILSLQASMAAALFLSEYCRFNYRVRLGLFLGSILGAIGANLIRTTLLAGLAASAGLQTAVRWHDLIAFGELALVFIGLGLACWRLNRKTSSHSRGATLPRTSVNDSRPISVSELRWVWGAIIATEAVAALLFYRPLSERAEHFIPHLPEPSASLHYLTVTPATKSMLQTNHISIWERRDGLNVSRAAYHIKWDNAVRATASLRLHNPTVCLPASGATFVDKLDPIEIRVKGGMLRFDRLRFKDQRGFYVVHTTCIDAAHHQIIPTDDVPQWRDWVLRRFAEVLRGPADYQYLCYAAWEPFDDAKISSELTEIFRDARANLPADEKASPLG